MKHHSSPARRPRQPRQPSFWLLACAVMAFASACATRQPPAAQPKPSASMTRPSAVTAQQAPAAAGATSPTPAVTAPAAPIAPIATTTPTTTTATGPAARPDFSIPTAAAPAAPPAPPRVLPYDDAVIAAAHALFTNAQLANVQMPSDASAKLMLVIDPLIDGQTGMQSVQTRALGKRLGELVKTTYTRYELQPFSTAALARAPMLLIGTFTPVDKDRKAVGERDRYWVCLSLIDLRTGKVVSKGTAFASLGGVDISPLPFFRDAPVWSPDPATEAYIRSCETAKPGDPIDPQYWERIVAAAMINDAVDAYHEGRYEDALDLYRGIARTPAGDQLRVYNGVYLAAWKLGRRDEAATAFARVVDHGLANKRLGVKFLFRTASTLFVGDADVAAPYPLWLTQIASRAGRSPSCLEVSGHTSRTGSEPLNERLSAMRAQAVQLRLLADMPGLAKRTATVGKGSRENIVGLGTDDARDALDRRVEFKVVDCAVIAAL
jgi:outer membrane protein OmpA-like peptidoglycan-associated protein